MDKLAFGASADEKTTEQRIQDEIAGDDILVWLLGEILHNLIIHVADFHRPGSVRAILEDCGKLR